ncbi:SpoIIE family protein phosphatase [Nocardioides sp. HDW12B]|uniref:PP2C family protein-serine/threonine phosphatase n=1 Tax=Nocardioides sp. HDW12B TaxID=2714939 RepID=UPI00140CD245|nr:SpoIIE family protein phosphatase [Nocardioides sp. HDW12B]QIK64938.1 SpoIIE family protein phosphatase [Nocardioides sp. HDW12B]
MTAADEASLLYQRAACGLLSTTLDGEIAQVNDTFLAWTGWAREELVGRRLFSELLSPGGRIYHETHFAPMLRVDGEVREMAFEIATATTRIPVLVNAVREQSPTGGPPVVQLAVFGVAERREYERELRRERDRAEASEVRARALAQTLQQTLIPPSPPLVPGLEVAAVYRPAGTGEEVGGDLYDVFQVADDDWVVVLGDVCGKGVQAAVVTALVRYTIRASSVLAPDPARVLADLDTVLLAHGSERFCTVVLLRLRRHEGAWTVRMVVGGHPLPLLKSGDDPPTPVGTPGVLVGAFPDVERTSTELALLPGDQVLLYTDGVTEGRRGRVMYDDDRLAATVASHTGDAASLTETVLADVLEFQGGLPRDDIALVALRVPDGD